MKLPLPAVLLLACALAHSPCGRSEDAKIGQPEQLVRSQFQELSMRQQGHTIVLEICFDLCDVFQWQGSPHSEGAWDFVVAYEYKRGVGKDSKEFISRG